MKNPLLFLACLLIPGIGSSIDAASPAQPNIIFIFADDWGYGDLGIHGSTFCKTPNLDRMASEGVDFTNFTVNSPVCSPSRVAVMTGQFPARQCVHQHFQGIKAHIKRGMPDWLDPQAPMLPRLLQEAGYKTGHFGKWHLGSAGDSPSEDAYGYDKFATFNGSKVNPIKKEGLASVDHAVQFINESKDETFFVNLWLHEAHLAHYPQQQYLEQFKDLDEQQRVYASIIAEGDEGVGRILRLLKELDIDRNTLVVFSTDNGPEKTRDANQKFHDAAKIGLGGYYSVGETGGLKGRKRSLFSGGVRVPFIVRWPGIAPAGKTDSTSVITAVDLLPTFLDVANVALPDGYQPDGESIVNAFKGGDFTRTKPIFWEWKGGDKQDFTWPTMGVRDGRWKLLVSPQEPRYELYDLVNDWAETKDVSAENPELVQQLSEKLDTWKEGLPTAPSANALSKARKKNSKK
ncbi:N-acetylgalactosamine-6-sulfatase [Neorhodopirellula lusitana]|uniref:N-acetylgalactosamine-6-sulfatase n=1 Tax=Neorhodopirellula lusitana TaxID=445327 RepID=A0ABY1Q491_9BACT|nr:sulfatase-like hydrolase/transferase [Neorhodopirellula lusitana]SMP58770.1 N-acetylgalactosamine-6-sulfatase [Neorhodopirellula lusitana]